MSQPEKPGGYQRSTSGLLGAILVLLLVVLVFVGFRGCVRGDQSVPVRAVPLEQVQQVAQAARSEGNLVAPIPDPIPAGWQVTSVSYRPGQLPSWHVGMLTKAERYVGIEERSASPSDMASDFVDEDAVEGEPIMLAGRSWTTWTDEGGDYAVATAVGKRTLMVVGSEADATIRDLAADLPLS